MGASDIIGVVAGSTSLLTNIMQLATTIKVAHGKLEPESGGGPTFVFPFNPQKLTLTRNPDWTDETPTSLGPRRMKYGGEPMDTLNFELLLDETELKGTTKSIISALLPFNGVSDLLGFALKNSSSVRAHAELLYGYTLPRIGTYPDMRPPVLTFTWGQLSGSTLFGKGFGFRGIIDDLSIEFLVFDADGNPRRATAELKMRGQAFFSGSPASIVSLKTKKDFDLEDTKRQKLMELGLDQSSLQGSTTAKVQK